MKSTIKFWRSPTLCRYTLREIQRRPWRTLLTLMGIAIGVAAVVAITAATRATHRAYSAMFEAIGGRAALEVVAEGQGGFDASLVERLAAAPGVQNAVGVIYTSAALRGKSGLASVVALGVDPVHDSEVRDYALREGRLLATLSANETGALLGADFARQQGLSLGSKVRLRTFSGAAEVTVVGLLEASGATLFNGGAVVFLPLPTAQRLFGMMGQVNCAQLVLEDGIEPARAEQEIERYLPDGLRVQQPLARGVVAQDSMGSTELALHSLSVVALGGAAFVILNSFLMNLEERRRQFAILRALGTTRAQLTWLLLREAMVLGLAGTVLGMILGTLLVRGLVTVQEGLLSVKLPPVPWTVEPFLLALMLGPGLALASVWLPARRAGRRAPLTDLLPVQVRKSAEGARRHSSFVVSRSTSIGIALIGLTLVYVVGLLWNWWGPAVNKATLTPLILLSWLVGSVLVLPLAQTPLLRVAPALLRPVAGVESRLAFRYLQRQRTRTALTTAVLFVGIVVMTGFGNSLFGSINNIRLWYRNAISADFFVRGGMPDMNGGSVPALSPALAEQLRQLDGVADVGLISFILGKVKGHWVVIMPRSFTADRPLALGLLEGEEAEVRTGLQRGEVVIGTAVAHRTGLKLGDNITLKTRQGPQSLRITGVAREYTGGGMALYLDWSAAEKLLALPGVHEFEVRARPGERIKASHALEAFCRERALAVQSNAEVWAGIDRTVRGVEGFLWLLMVLIFVIASLGVVNTLTMNIHEQTRELGVLRAIGLRRGQVGKLILAQALTLGVVSVPPGIGVGLLLAYMMNLSSLSLTGHPVAFRFYPGFVAGCAATVLVTAVAAAVLPARRAARLHIIEALRYE